MKFRLCFVLFSVIIFYFGCTENQKISDELSDAIDLFYQENENRSVIDSIEKYEFFKHNAYENQLSKIIYAGALCEYGKIDSARNFLISTPVDTANISLKFWFNSIYGLVLFRSDSIPKSFMFLTETLKNHHADIRALALNKRILARISFALSDYEKGIEWLLASNKLFKETGLKKSIGVNYKLLGRYYMIGNNFQDALESFNLAEKLFIEANDSCELFYIYNNFIDYNLKTANLTEAEQYAMRSYRFLTDSNDLQKITLIYNNLGEIEFKRGNFDKAKANFFKTLGFGNNYTSSVLRRINSYFQLSEIYKVENNTTLARKYADSARLLLPTSGYYRLKYKIYAQLSDVYKDEPIAIPFLKIATQYLDSANMSLTKATKSFYNAKNEQEKTETELKNLIYDQNRKKIIALAIIISVILILLIIHSQVRNRARLLKTLVEKNLKIIDEERKMNALLHQQIDNKRSSKRNHTNDSSNKLFDEFICWLESNKNFTRKDINLEMAVRELNTNRDYLSRAISEKNLRFNDIVNKHRVEEAITILANPDDKRNNYSLKFLASEVGFNSDSVFIEAFRRQTGMTPAQFRKTLYDNGNV